MSAQDRFVSDTMLKMQRLPKSQRLECLQEQLQKLPINERREVEQGVFLALYSVDHSPAENISIFRRFISVLHVADLLGVPILMAGICLMILSYDDSKLTINLEDKTIYGSGAGIILIIIGISVCFLARIFSRPEK